MSRLGEGLFAKIMNSCSANENSGGGFRLCTNGSIQGNEKLHSTDFSRIVLSRP